MANILKYLLKNSEILMQGRIISISVVSGFHLSSRLLMPQVDFFHTSLNVNLFKQLEPNIQPVPHSWTM